MAREYLVWVDCGKYLEAYTPWGLHAYSLLEIETKRYKVYTADEGVNSKAELSLLIRDSVSLRRGRRICQYDFNKGRKQFLKVARNAD